MTEFQQDKVPAECCRKRATGTYVILALLGIATLWVYLPTLQRLAHTWSTDSHYSHGFLVPAFALALLWLRRDRLKAAQPGFWWWGIALLALSGLLRWVAAFIYFDWLDAFSLLPCVAGIAVLLGGRKALAWSWPAIVFLVFMIPLPYRVQTALGFPLQRIATITSTYLLQTAGLPALAEGNTILLNEYHLGVVEACNGLGMLVAFFALATAVVLVVQRDVIEKIILFASAIPIAILSNVVRITLTGILYETAGSEVADFVFHDLAGWLMMPIALAFLWLELKMLSLLLVERQVPERTRIIPKAGTSTAPAATDRERQALNAGKAKKKSAPAANKVGLAKAKK